MKPDNVGKIDVIAERPVAYDSPDHINPWGTRRDNSQNRRFNTKLGLLFHNKELPVHVLDLGCSGGGFVKSCIDDGFLAVGLEGSDYSKRHQRAEWATIPNYLFTCDITRPFTVGWRDASGIKLMQFDVVTSWEVIEHITEQDLSSVAINVERHLAPSGIWIMSVSPNEEIAHGVRLHQTVRPRSWWLAKFSELGWHHLAGIDEFFNTQYVRGPKYGAPGSFHLVLGRIPSMAPQPPPYPLSERLYDTWLGSRFQRKLRKLVVGE